MAPRTPAAASLPTDDTRSVDLLTMCSLSPGEVDSFSHRRAPTTRAAKQHVGLRLPRPHAVDGFVGERINGRVVATLYRARTFRWARSGPALGRAGSAIAGSPRRVPPLRLDLPNFNGFLGDERTFSVVSICESRAVGVSESRRERGRIANVHCLHRTRSRGSRARRGVSRAGSTELGQRAGRSRRVQPVRPDARGRELGTGS